MMPAFTFRLNVWTLSKATASSKVRNPSSTVWGARHGLRARPVSASRSKIWLTSSAALCPTQDGGRIRFAPDGNWQREFEDAFEFEETPDQLTAIRDIKRDLEKSTPMDRLLCGDVGYGKTEVAMRAAFKAVADGKQVAVLTPTTVLAFQHFETFKKRFAAFPTRIEMLSRFRTSAEQKTVLTDLEAGKVDIVIGTHRLLSKDVKFQDLGILIVDKNSALV